MSHCNFCNLPCSFDILFISKNENVFTITNGNIPAIYANIFFFFLRVISVLYHTFVFCCESQGYCLRRAIQHLAMFCLGCQLGFEQL